MNQAERIAVESLDRIWESWRYLHRKELERERAEDHAAIREAREAIGEFATAKGAIWFTKHAAAIRRAQEAK